ncbi:hypothetical protein GQ54DRAFT_297521 [Martensiomyces pterosporus]|nr:hypothetical protein GQ54DRAFT_297521 [Martensiomyces pterosporus]
MYYRRAERRRVRHEKHHNPLTEADLDILPKYELNEESIADILRPHDRRRYLINSSGVQQATLTAPEPAHLAPEQPSTHPVSDQQQQQQPSGSAPAEGKGKEVLTVVSETPTDETEESRYAPTETSASCVICLEDYAIGEVVRVLPCGHVFHDDCITHWLLRPKTKFHDCPMCKTPCFPEEVIAKAHEEARRTSEVEAQRNSRTAIVSVF